MPFLGNNLKSGTEIRNCRFVTFVIRIAKLLAFLLFPARSFFLKISILLLSSAADARAYDKYLRRELFDGGKYAAANLLMIYNTAPGIYYGM